MLSRMRPECLLQVCIRITCARARNAAAPTPGMYKGYPVLGMWPRLLQVCIRVTCALNVAAPTPGMYKGYLCSECGRAYSRYVKDYLCSDGRAYSRYV